jgi:hypothetical protein
MALLEIWVLATAFAVAMDSWIHHRARTSYVLSVRTAAVSAAPAEPSTPGGAPSETFGIAA